MKITKKQISEALKKNLDETNLGQEVYFKAHEKHKIVYHGMGYGMDWECVDCGIWW